MIVTFFFLIWLFNLVSNGRWDKVEGTSVKWLWEMVIISS